MKFLKNLFHSLFSYHRPLDEFDRNQKKVRESLTHLIYQHSKMTEKQTQIIDENEMLALDLEESVKANHDDLSIQIIEKLEQNKEELHFINEQVKELEENISQLSSAKKEIESSRGRYKDLLSVHESKKTALQAKKEIHEQLNELNSDRQALNSKSYLAELKDQIHKTNAEISLLKDEAKEQDALKYFRQNRIKREHLNKLNMLKEKFQTQKAIIIK